MITLFSLAPDALSPDALSPDAMKAMIPRLLGVLQSNSLNPEQLPAVMAAIQGYVSRLSASAQQDILDALRPFSSVSSGGNGVLGDLPAIEARADGRILNPEPILLELESNPSSETLVSKVSEMLAQNQPHVAIAIWTCFEEQFDDGALNGCLAVLQGCIGHLCESGGYANFMVVFNPDFFDACGAREPGTSTGSSWIKQAIYNGHMAIALKLAEVFDTSLPQTACDLAVGGFCDDPTQDKAYTIAYLLQHHTPTVDRFREIVDTCARSR